MVNPMGCRWCGIDKREHGRRWKEPACVTIHRDLALFLSDQGEDVTEQEQCQSKVNGHASSRRPIPSWGGASGWAGITARTTSAETRLDGAPTARRSGR